MQLKQDITLIFGVLDCSDAIGMDCINIVEHTNTGGTYFYVTSGGTRTNGVNTKDAKDGRGYRHDQLQNQYDYRFFHNQ